MYTCQMLFGVFYVCFFRVDAIELLDEVHNLFDTQSIKGVYHGHENPNFPVLYGMDRRTQDMVGNLLEMYNNLDKKQEITVREQKPYNGFLYPNKEKDNFVLKTMTMDFFKRIIEKKPVASLHIPHGKAEVLFSPLNQNNTLNACDQQAGFTSASQKYITELHYDENHTVITTLSGKKTWLCQSPTKPDDIMLFETTPGTILYLPRHWRHMVKQFQQYTNHYLVTIVFVIFSRYGRLKQALPSVSTR